MSEQERHDWITQILRALADLRAAEQGSVKRAGGTERHAGAMGSQANDQHAAT